MSNSAFSEREENDQSGDTLIILVNKDGTLTVDPHTLHRVLANQSRTTISVVRIEEEDPHETNDDDDDDDENEDDRSKPKSPRVNMTVEGYFPPIPPGKESSVTPVNIEEQLQSIIGENCGFGSSLPVHNGLRITSLPSSSMVTISLSQSLADGSISDTFGEAFSALDSDQIKQLEAALHSEKAKQIFGDDVTSMLDSLKVNEGRDNTVVKTQDNIFLDHCYTSIDGERSQSADEESNNEFSNSDHQLSTSDIQDKSQFDTSAEESGDSADEASTRKRPEKNKKREKGIIKEIPRPKVKSLIIRKTGNSRIKREEQSGKRLIQSKLQFKGAKDIKTEIKEEEIAIEKGRKRKDIRRSTSIAEQPAGPALFSTPDVIKNISNDESPQKLLKEVDLKRTKVNKSLLDNAEDLLDELTRAVDTEKTHDADETLMSTDDDHLLNELSNIEGIAEVDANSLIDELDKTIPNTSSSVVVPKREDKLVIVKLSKQKRANNNNIQTTSSQIKLIDPIHLPERKLLPTNEKKMDSTLGNNSPTGQLLIKKAPSKKNKPMSLPSGGMAGMDGEDDPNKLWCICNKPHNNRFMICCDICDNWFHGYCVGISKIMGERMEQNGTEWICPLCKKEQGIKEREMKQKRRLASKIKRDSLEANSSKDSNADTSASSESMMEVDTTTPNTKLNTTQTPLLCPICKQNNVSNNYAYCNSACLEKYIQESLTLLSGDKTEPLPNEHRIMVCDRKGGKLLAGPNAPTVSNLKLWLEENPTFEIVRPNTLPTSKFYGKETKSSSTPSKQQQSQKLDTKVKIIAQKHTGVNSIKNYMTKDPEEEKRRDAEKRREEEKRKYSEAVKMKEEERKKSTDIKSNDEGKKKLIEITKIKEEDRKRPLEISKAREEERRKELSKTIDAKKSQKGTQKLLVQQKLDLMKKKTDNTKTGSVIVKPPIKPIVQTKKTDVSKKEKITTPPMKKEIKRSDSSISKHSSDNENDDEDKDAKLNSIRVSVRKSLHETLSTRLKDLQDITLSTEQLMDMANDIENELFDLFKDTGVKYKSRYRSLLFNVKDKKNTLYRKIVEKAISSHDLVRLTPEEMASQELAQWRERETKHELEKIKKSELELLSHAKTLVMKTHKGELEIEPEGRLGSDVTVPELQEEYIEEKPLNKKGDTLTYLREKERMLMESIKERTERRKEESSKRHEKGSHKDHKKSNKHRRRSTSKHKHSHRDSSKKRHSSHKYSKRESKSKKEEKSKEDVEMKTEQSTISPSSPTMDSVTTNQPIWKGVIIMPDVAKFKATIKEVSGNCSDVAKDIQSPIDCVGRITPSTVWEYISKMKKSGTKDIIVFRLEMLNEDERVDYLALYSYLSSKKRLAVVGNKTPTVKDFYVYALSAQSPVPQVLLPLDGPGFEDNRPHLLLGILIRNRVTKNTNPVGGTYEPTSSNKVEEKQADASPSDVQDSFTPPHSPTSVMITTKPLVEEIPYPNMSESPQDDEEDDGNEPYSPGSGIDDEDYEVSAIDIQRKMDLINKQIAMEKERIESMKKKSRDDEAYSPTNLLVPDADSVQLPSDIQEILDNLNKPTDQLLQSLPLEEDPIVSAYKRNKEGSSSDEDSDNELFANADTSQDMVLQDLSEDMDIVEESKVVRDPRIRAPEISQPLMQPPPPGVEEDFLQTNIQNSFPNMMTPYYTPTMPFQPQIPPPYTPNVMGPPQNVFMPPVYHQHPVPFTNVPPPMYTTHPPPMIPPLPNAQTDVRPNKGNFQRNRRFQNDGRNNFNKYNRDRGKHGDDRSRSDRNSERSKSRSLSPKKRGGYYNKRGYGYNRNEYYRKKDHDDDYKRGGSKYSDRNRFGYRYDGRKRKQEANKRDKDETVAKKNKKEDENNVKEKS